MLRGGLAGWKYKCRIRRSWYHTRSPPARSLRYTSAPETWTSWLERNGGIVRGVWGRYPKSQSYMGGSCFPLGFLVRRCLSTEHISNQSICGCFRRRSLWFFDDLILDGNYGRNNKIGEDFTLSMTTWKPPDDTQWEVQKPQEYILLQKKVVHSTPLWSSD